MKMHGPGNIKFKNEDCFRFLRPATRQVVARFNNITKRRKSF
jgi:hypothetical protein